MDFLDCGESESSFFTVYRDRNVGLGLVMQLFLSR